LYFKDECHITSKYFFYKDYSHDRAAINTMAPTKK
jgi:hypothetical protein